MCAGADKCLVFTTDDTSTVLTPSQTHFFIWRTLSILNNFLIHSPACSALKRLSSRLLSPPRMPEVVPGSRTTVHTSAALRNATASTITCGHLRYQPKARALLRWHSQRRDYLQEAKQQTQPVCEKRPGYFHDVCDAALGWSWLEDVWGAWLHLGQSHKCLQEDGRAEPLTRGRCWKWQCDTSCPSDSVGGALWARPKPAES